MEQCLSVAAGGHGGGLLGRQISTDYTDELTSLDVGSGSGIFLCNPYNQCDLCYKKLCVNPFNLCNLCYKKLCVIHIICVICVIKGWGYF